MFKTERSHPDLPRRAVNLCGPFDLVIMTLETMMERPVPLLAMVVEDDQLQREVLAEALASLNLDIIQCASAAAAELIVSRIGPELQLLVADLWLSERADGAELVQFAKQQFPHLRIVAISGDENLALPPNIRFLRKPYCPSDVVRAAATPA